MIEIFLTENEEKSALIKQQTRTIKEQMFKYFKTNFIKRYTEVVDVLVQQFNNRSHSAIEMMPVKASLKINAI